MKNIYKEKLDNIFCKILTANVYGISKKTPLDKLQQISNKKGCEIFLKREDLQPVFSFKCRGAYNKIIKLLKSKPDIKGVICASAGNHAQGVAVTARSINIHATIVMPIVTPKIKVDAVKRFGEGFVRVVLHGNNFDEAANHAKEIQKKDNLEFIHPFDDNEVIAGQGTIGKEIIEDLNDIYAIFIPVGGGGLLAGVGAYIKYLKPEIKIIGVEPVESASMAESIKNKKRVCLNHVGGFADGVAVKQVGEKTFDIAKEVVDEMITVTTDEICASINQIFNEKRIVCEPSGAVALAGIQEYIDKNNIKGKKLVGILSGANMNFDRLRHVTERTAFGAKTESLFGVHLKEEVGSFKKLCKEVGKRPITEFNYRCNNSKSAQVFMGVGIQDKDEGNKVLNVLTKKGYDIVDLTDNNLAKLHLRYLVGGKLNDKEVLYRIEFPEKPGALLNFLEKMGDYNITLFHYRNHGSDYGRVLVGFSVPPDIKLFEKQLEDTGYYFVNESNNPAYKRFL